MLRRTARRNNRRLLKRGDPHEILNRLIEERHPVYAQADVVVDSVHGPPEMTLARVFHGLGRFPALEPAAGLRSAVLCTPRRPSASPAASAAPTSSSAPPSWQRRVS